MIKKTGILLIMVLVFVALPVGARTLFLQTGKKDDAAAKAVVFAEKSYAIKSFKLKYANASSLRDSLAELAAEGEKVSVNRGLNTIIVRASKENLARITALIKEIDTAPAQVKVEAKIIELKSGNGDASNPSYLGMEWKYTNPNDPQDYAELKTTETGTIAATPLGLYAQLISGNVDAYLRALERTVGYDLIASPWITALNHEESEILIGSKYGYKTTIVTETSTLQEVKFLSVGTKLRFTPHINEDGYIIMDIYPSVSEGTVINDLPQEHTTETRNKVLVKDGQPIVVGGLTKEYNQEREIGVPILAHIPFLGHFFKRTELVSEKRDIMVIITPHIVTPEFLEEMHQRMKDLEERRKKSAGSARLLP